MTKRSRPYLSYLLRLWRSGKGEEAAWRASLESPMTGKRRGFASLKDLFAFLETQADGAALRQAQDAASQEFEIDDDRRSKSKSKSK